MSEKLSDFHEAVEQSTAEISDVINHKRHSSSVSEGFGDRTQVADIGGSRLVVSVDKGLNPYERAVDSTEVVAATNPIEELGNIPEPFIPGNEVDLGLRHDSARMRHAENSDGSRLSHASVKTSAGKYLSREYNYGATGTYVERPGYGKVEIKNPRARVLVAHLAGKAIRSTQDSIQDVKGKELVEDREWLKKARRSARKVMGKRVA